MTIVGAPQHEGSGKEEDPRSPENSSAKTSLKDIQNMECEALSFLRITDICLSRKLLCEWKFVCRIFLKDC